MSHRGGAHNGRSEATDYYQSRQPVSSGQMKIDSGHLLLQHGDTRLTLDAAHGGAIREFGWRDRPIFRPTPRSAGADPFELGCFPMVPYANRIAHSRFSFGARTVQLKQNRRNEPHPLHGQGWLSPWAVIDATASSATLMFEGGGDEWPWRYRARQHLQLNQDALAVSLSIENLAQSAMPVMLGLHPYFCDPALAQLQAAVPRVWLTDSASLPVEEVATPIDWSFDSARSIAAVPLDHCFVDWDGRASLRWPDRRLGIRAMNCRYLHVYAPAGRDFFCVEPQSAPAGALNRGADEATVLGPNGRFEMRVHFEVGVA
jgi:aldose 1-epimerase